MNVMPLYFRGKIYSFSTRSMYEPVRHMLHFINNGDKATVEEWEERLDAWLWCHTRDGGVAAGIVVEEDPDYEWPEEITAILQTAAAALKKSA